LKGTCAPCNNPSTCTSSSQCCSGFVCADQISGPSICTPAIA
jgi:hypothetical protein